MSNKAEDLKNRMRNKKPSVQEKAIFPNGVPDKPLLENSDSVNNIVSDIDSNTDSIADDKMKNNIQNDNNNEFETNDNNISNTVIDVNGAHNANNNIDSVSNIDISSDNDSDIESDIVIDSNFDIDSKIDSIFQTRKKREEEVTYRGFYIENDLVRVLDRLAKQHGKGVKSELVNGLLRKEFIARKLLK